MNASTRNRALQLAVAMVIIIAESTRLKVNIHRRMHDGRRGTCGTTDDRQPCSQVSGASLFR